MKKISKQSKTSAKWLFGLWAVLFVLFLASSLYLSEPKNIVKLNNLNPQWCGKYQYYLDNNVSSDCLRRCWEEYGCEHNATGRLNECVCTGGPLLLRSYVGVSQDIHGSFNSSVNTVGIDRNGNKIEVKLK